MKRTLAVVMAALLACPGCGVHFAARGFPIPVSRARQQADQSLPPRSSDAATWQRYLANLPVGAKVKVQTRDGRSFKAVFMGLEGENATFNPRTRIPEPVRTIPVSSLTVVELDQGTNVGKTVAIAAGAAGAAVLGVLLILIAAIDD